MAELDAILKKYTDPSTSNLHGATFVAVDGKGGVILPSLCSQKTPPLTPR